VPAVSDAQGKRVVIDLEGNGTGSPSGEGERRIDVCRQAEVYLGQPPEGRIEFGEREGHIESKHSSQLCCADAFSVNIAMTRAME